VATADLVAAVANAGAMGFLTPSPSIPRAPGQEIRRCRDLTDRPFGVTSRCCHHAGARLRRHRRRVRRGADPWVETAGNNPERLLPGLKVGGVRVAHKCTSVRHARTAVALGCDAIVIDGFECAGHPGEDDVTSLVLIPITADAVKVPVIASGGFGDGRGLVAALAWVRRASTWAPAPRHP